MASNKASQAHTHDLTRPAKAAAEGGTVCKKSRQSHRIQPMGSQTSTPTPKLILRVALGKRESFVGAKRNRLAVYLFVSFFKLGFQFSLRAIEKILFQTHLLTCKCHPVRFRVITSIESCTSTPTPQINFYACPRKLGGRKTMVGDMRNTSHVSLFAMVFKSFSKSFAKQSKRFFSKRMFFLVNATQVDIVH